MTENENLTKGNPEFRIQKNFGFILDPNVVILESKLYSDGEDHLT